MSTSILYLVEASRICDSQAASAPFPPPAENALLGSVFDFLENTPPANLSASEHTWQEELNGQVSVGLSRRIPSPAYACGGCYQHIFS